MNVDLILGEVLVMFSMHTLTPLFSVTKLVNAAYYQLGPDFKWPGERHDFWEVVYVDRGEAVITAGEEEYPLKAGRWSSIAPTSGTICALPRARPLASSLLLSSATASAWRPFAAASSPWVRRSASV